jgi:hypothetical protein
MLAGWCSFLFLKDHLYWARPPSPAFLPVFLLWTVGVWRWIKLCLFVRSPDSIGLDHTRLRGLATTIQPYYKDHPLQQDISFSYIQLRLVTPSQSPHLLFLSGFQLLKPPQVHLPLQQRNHIRIERLPVWVTKMILLRRLTQVPLDNGEILLVVDGLHDEPGERFLVLGVDRGCFEEFGVEFGDGFWVGFGTEVYRLFIID